MIIQKYKNISLKDLSFYIKCLMIYKITKTILWYMENKELEKVLLHNTLDNYYYIKLKKKNILGYILLN